MDSQKELLDQLLGKQRDLTKEQLAKQKETYSDDFVCKNYLVSMCYNELFPKTNYDLGPCHKRHDPMFKYNFENEESYKKYRCERKYIQGALDFMEDKVQEVDYKIKSKQQSLEKNGQFTLEQRPQAIQESIEKLDEQIKKLQAEAEALGEEGKLEESEQKAAEAEKQQLIKDETIKQVELMAQGAMKDQEVCQICGAYQATSDLDKRKLVHLEGKIHLGFKFFREEITRLKERLVVVKEKEEEWRKKDKNRSRSRDRKHKKHSKKSSRHHSSKRRHSQSSSRSSSRDRRRKKHSKKKHSSRKRDYSSSGSSSRSRSNRRR